MKNEEYELMFRAEREHWWYQGMEVISRSLIEKYYPKAGTLKILDAGCGTGGMTAVLGEYGLVYGLEISPLALGFCRRRNQANLSCGSVDRLPFQSDRFDLITSFDVLCIKGLDDERILEEFKRVLVPGGRVFLRLPACPWLRGAHDRAVDIGQRYRIDSLREKIIRAGLLVEHLTYANMWLFPLAVLKRGLEFILPSQEGSDLTWSLGSFNGIFKTILSSEAYLVPRMSLPIGLTAVAIARKIRSRVDE